MIFMQKMAFGTEENSINIEVEALIIDLNKEQLRHFRNNLEWWDIVEKKLIESPPAAVTDGENVKPALRVYFKGGYDKEEDDFYGNTFFVHH